MTKGDKFKFYRLGRLEASQIDFSYAMFFGTIISILFIINKIYYIPSFIICILFSLKDFLNENRSSGKKNKNLQVLTKDNKIPNKITLFGRNLFVIIFPIEILMILIFGQRIGDIIFNTKVVEYEPIEKKKIDVYGWGEKWKYGE